MKYQVLIIPMPDKESDVQKAINVAAGKNQVASVSTLPGPFGGQPGGHNGLMLMIVLSTEKPLAAP